MKIVEILIQREEDAEDLPLPQYQTPGASGMDLVCAERLPVVLNPRETKLFSTGIRISLPEGYEAQVRPRSGLALKNGITLLNSPGTIDSDYRGLVSVILHNASNHAFQVTRGMRIAQMVIQSVVKAQLRCVVKLDATVRSDGGFGHTGHS